MSGPKQLVSLIQRISSVQGFRFELRNITGFLSKPRLTFPTYFQSVSLYSTNKPKNPVDNVEFDSDSDDEKNFYSHRGESHFWRRKMRTLHRLLDVNKDGVLSYDDFQLLTERFSNLGHLSPVHQNEFKQIIQSVWEKQHGSVHAYNFITIEQFLEDMHHALNDKSLRKNIHVFLPYLFRAVDRDKNEEITVEEFKLFFTCLGLDNEDAAVSFHAIDQNDDGRLTINEFVHLGKEFLLSEDEKSPSKWFWGPLIQH